MELYPTARSSSVLLSYMFFGKIIIGALMLLFMSFTAKAQQRSIGMIAGQVLDSAGSKAVEGTTVRLQFVSDTGRAVVKQTDRYGNFLFRDLAFGFYKIEITASGFQSRRIDSIHIRDERADFNLGDIYLGRKITDVTEVIIYAEKPMIESKDGNITFNVGESALSAGSNAAELLRNTPLVTTDPNGNVLVRGKEPRILIDEKPVELNAQQLQDLLESMPGSNIEKIEVMTNPPAQFANEQGGVINIVTRKGKIGMSARLNVYGGTRNELGTSVNLNYRKQGLAINFNAGLVNNVFQGDGYSYRTNIFRDSSNQLLINNQSRNENSRPNMRLNIDYDLNKYNALSVTANYNFNRFDNAGLNNFANVNRFGQVWKRSEREVSTIGFNENFNTQVSFTKKGKMPGRTLRIIGTANAGTQENDRLFYQQFLNAVAVPTGIDSTQRQENITFNSGYGLRINYDYLFKNKTTSFSAGSAFSRTASDVLLYTSFMRKPEAKFDTIALLSNDFHFHQDVFNARLSLKQILKEGFSISAGTAWEHTNIYFALHKDNANVRNRYFNWLPFLNINRSWKNKTSMTLTYRQSIRRPGIREMNPAIDYSDPYNLRYGNPYLKPSIVHNFDFVVGKTKEKYFVNMGMGYNRLQDIFNQLRSLQPDGVTVFTWDNVSGRREYEISTWGGLTFSRILRLNMSASYIYNEYSSYDKQVRKFRNGGTFTSSMNANFTPTQTWTFTGSFTFNRFANPQGTVRNNINMNIGIQHKLFDKRLTVGLNAIDPLIVQQNRVFTFGPNFNLESFSRTQTRNFRLTLGYQLNKTITRKKQMPTLFPKSKTPTRPQSKH